MATQLKTTYELVSKFKPCYSSGRPIYVTHDDNIVCSRDSADGIDINYLDRKTLTSLGNLNIANESVTTFTISSERDILVLATKSLILQSIDIKQKKILKSWKAYHTHPIYRLALNPSGTRLASGGADNLVRIWHLGSGEGVTRSCRHHKSLISLVQFHPTLPLLVSSSTMEYELIFWDSESGDMLATLQGHQAQITAVDFHIENNMMASCSRDKVIFVWDCLDYQRLITIPTYESLESCLFLRCGPFSSSPHIVSGGQSGDLKVWSCDRRICVQRFIIGSSAVVQGGGGSGEGEEYTPNSILVLRHCPDNHLMVVRQSDNIEFFEGDTMSLEAMWTGELGEIRDAALCGVDRRMLLVAEASNRLKIFPDAGCTDPSEGGTSSNGWWCRVSLDSHEGEICALSVNSSNRLLAVTGSRDKKVGLWRLDEDRGTAVMVARGNGHSGHVTAVSFDKEPKYILSGGDDYSIRMWEIPTLEDSSKPIQSIASLSMLGSFGGAHSDSINDIAVSINSKFAGSASKDKTAKIWKMESRISLAGVLRGHRRGVWSIRFSPVEKCALTAAGDGELRIWNLDDFSCLKTLEGHDCPIYKAVYISNGQQILACDQKGLVRLWNVSSMDIVQSVEAHDGRVWTIEAAPEGDIYFTGGEDNTLCLYKDITEQVEEEKRKKSEEFIQCEQELSNLLQSKSYSKAIRLAIKLDQPNRTLNIIKDILVDCESELEPALEQLDEASIRSLLGYTVRWNTNSRSSWPAQKVLHHVLSRFHPDTILQWPGIDKALEPLIAYSDRHYRRICRIQEQMGMVDYICSALQHGRKEEQMDLDQLDNLNKDLGVVI